jgi:hypothetical protein
MDEAAATRLDWRATLGRILAAPTPADLWQLQKELLAQGGRAARRAREVAGQFCGYLRDLESKVTSRQASRRAALLATGAVTSVGLQELAVEQEDLLRRILSSAVTAALEVGAATQYVRAWEIETSLVHYDVAWYLYGELWEISSAMQPRLSAKARLALLDELLRPILEPDVTGAVKSALLVTLFRAVLAARVLPLLEDTAAAE